MDDLETFGNFVVCQLASYMNENFVGVCALRTICQNGTKDPLRDDLEV
jgi:hypothetical protein